MSKRLLIAGGAALAALLALAPTSAVQAQGVANDKVLVVFGDDPCPAGTICVRKGASERFRIPKELRDSTPSAGNERWADRAKSIDSVGATGTGSCTNVGAGGWTGCWAKEMRQAKAARKADAEAGAVPEK